MCYINKVELELELELGIPDGEAEKSEINAPVSGEQKGLNKRDCFDPVRQILSYVEVIVAYRFF